MQRSVWEREVSKMWIYSQAQFTAVNYNTYCGIIFSWFWISVRDSLLSNSLKIKLKNKTKTDCIFFWRERRLWGRGGGGQFTLLLSSIVDVFVWFSWLCSTSIISQNDQILQHAGTAVFRFSFWTIPCDSVRDVSKKRTNRWCGFHYLICLNASYIRYTCR